LEQRQIDISGSSMLLIMEIMSIFLNCKVKEIKMNTKNPKFRIKTSSIKNNDILINYLNKYPLRSSKYMDYCNWKEGFLLFKDSKHSTIEGLNRIKILKNSMNNKRQEFNWDHLIDFS
jgi:hypothetical protein